MQRKSDFKYEFLTAVAIICFVPGTVLSIIGHSNKQMGCDPAPNSDRSRCPRLPITWAVVTYANFTNRTCSICRGGGSDPCIEKFAAVCYMGKFMMKQRDADETCTTVWNYEDDEQTAHEEAALYQLGSTLVMFPFGGPKGCGRVLPNEYRTTYRMGEVMVRIAYCLLFVILSLPVFRNCCRRETTDGDQPETGLPSGDKDGTLTKA